MPKAKTTKIIKCYLSPEEYAAITSKASQANLSNSTFAKKVCLGITLQSKTDQEAVLALIRANAALGRLGGLLKKHLAENPKDEHVRELLRDISPVKIEVAKQVNKVAEALLSSKGGSQ